MDPTGWKTWKPLATMPFDAGILADIYVSKPQVDADVVDLLARRTFKGPSQVEADLILAGVIDYTNLDGKGARSSVLRLSRRALAPVNRKLLDKLGYPDLSLTTGAICVYPRQVKRVAAIIQGRIPIAVVATDFPHGQNSSLALRCQQIREAVADGANEVDVVIVGEFALDQDWRQLYDELVAMKEACGTARMKVILRTGDIEDYQLIAKATAVAIMAGADFVKTSTGMDPVNATFPIGHIMMRIIRRFYYEFDPGRMVGEKPAGGIRTAADARKWLVLMFEELGSIDRRWISPELLRLGASPGLLDDLNLQLMANAEGGGDNYPDPTALAMA